MKALICGGRNYHDYDEVCRVLGAIHKTTPFTKIINGAARGADTLAQSWARINKIETQQYPAQWKVHGKGAGPIRNQQMIDEEHPELVIAFPGGTGTADMCKRALDAKIKLIRA